MTQACLKRVNQLLTKLTPAAALLLITVSATAQITTIPVETATNALVLQVDSKKDVKLTYFGEKLSDPSGYALIPGQFKQTSDYTGLYNSAYTPSGSHEKLQ
ncbi:MAG: hypothetical protein AB7V25_01535 [Mangrovibacterium sp.]